MIFGVKFTDRLEVGTSWPTLSPQPPPPDRPAGHQKRAIAWTKAGLRIFGAGITSSTTESIFALESALPNCVTFDLERVIRTKYPIDDFQQTYFLVDSFEKLLEACYRDFGPIYEQIGMATDIEAHELIDSDKVLARGTLAWLKEGRT